VWSVKCAVWSVKCAVRSAREENGGFLKRNREQRLLGMGYGVWSVAYKKWSNIQSFTCKGMRSDIEEGVAKGCKARITIPKVL